ncbi:Hypothetical predicted protein [Olea europaea subsp. europaea]|uniref:Uncharacterized protein n=1 Tax=Olea europaea subsp. europaea TaxID=158383 RepID=A0A8S0RQ93_OLEEU|nr:Hypothetical predicted protein [Olea europaea subsp. europaea]
MASKYVLFLSFFLLNTNSVSSVLGKEVLYEAAAVIVPLPSPVYKKPTPAQPLKAPPPPPPPPTRASPQPPPPVKPPRNRQECIPLCLVRCKLHSRKKYCLRACMTCCERCKCVPPGQYGNKEKCGKCYSDMTTRGGKLKCP